MSASQIALTWAVTFAAILSFRTLPLLLLRGRSLSPRVGEALGLIPAAAFAGLVANDLLDPSAIARDPLAAASGLVAAVIVAIVARRTKSLVLCTAVGMLAYALLGLLA